MKRSAPIRRTGIKRGKGLSRSKGIKRSGISISGKRAGHISTNRRSLKRTGINAVSDKRKVENRERQKVPLLDYCEAKAAGAPGSCFGRLHRHEVLTAARGGSRTDPKNIRTVCDGHNTAISQDVETMRWAYDNGLLKHAWDTA